MDLLSACVQFYGGVVRRVAVGMSALCLVGCASHGAPKGDAQVYTDPDPWVGFNRSMFNFNLQIDAWVLKPTAKGYDVVVPKPVKRSVGNFFDNVAEVPNIANDVFQWKWKRAGLDGSRLLINSTLGVVGLFDVASKFGISKNPGEDAGQTVARWGVKRGPYVVLPFLGSTTLRDGVMMPVDYFTNPITYITPTTPRYVARGVDIVHARSELLGVEDLASGDLYLFVRDAYLQRRTFLEADGQIENEFEDDFGDDGFGDEGF